ncbi:MAG: hypothetical protein K8R21_14785 [Leptospira sp.]|nr:hypothetical protein [Leptospira sp.]
MSDIINPDNFGITESGPDFISEIELKTLMLQYTPQTMKDINSIEKGVESFFLFDQAPYALAKIEQISSLKEKDIQFMVEKRVIASCKYIEFSEEEKQLHIKTALIRPVSLQFVQAQKVKRACLRESIISILKFVHHRDKMIQTLQKNSTLSDFVNNTYKRTDEGGNLLGFKDHNSLLKRMKNLETLSFEYFLERQMHPDESLLTTVISRLSQGRSKLLEDLSETLTLPEEALNALEERGNGSILLSLTPALHIISPAVSGLMEYENDQIKVFRTEVECILPIFSELGKNILISILPEEDSPWSKAGAVVNDEQILEELRKHPSFAYGDQWPGGADFIEGYSTLLTTSNTLFAARRENALDILMMENLKVINMKFDAFHLTDENFQVIDSILADYNNDRTELFGILKERILGNPVVLAVKERRAENLSSGIYILYKENLARAFIQNKKRRSFLHLMAKDNNFARGIYDFLIDVSGEGIPKAMIEEQIQLSKSISEWEKELEEEKRKKEEAKKPFLQKILEFILKLFGFHSEKRREEDSAREQGFNFSEKQKSDPDLKKNQVAVKAPSAASPPRERQILISSRVQKAIDYVDRKNKGLIWLDELMHALGSPNFTYESVSDMLFYDQKRRYSEVRVLNEVRHVFINKEMEAKKEWLKSTIIFLESNPSKHEYQLLASHLKNKLQS